MAKMMNLSLDMHNARDDNKDHYIKLTLDIPHHAPNQKQKTIFAYSDISGSMSDPCRDGRTKQQHINHTWTNLLHFLAEHPEFNVSIELEGFEENLREVIPLTKVTDTNVEILAKEVNKMRPMGCTNIEQALRDLVEKCSASSSTRNYSLIMTDGEATDGELCTDKLADIVPRESRFAAIAFGIEHNADLMYKLGTRGMNTTNWLVSDLERSALVYAEILTKWMYQVLDDVTITIRNGLLYDYLTNTWVSSLSMGALSAEEKKYIHVKSETPEMVKVEVRGVVIDTETSIVEAIAMKDNIVPKGVVVDLTRDIYRLRVQELLYEAMTLPRDTDPEGPNVFNVLRATHNRVPFTCLKPPRLVRQKNELWDINMLQEQMLDVEVDAAAIEKETAAAAAAAENKKNQINKLKNRINELKDVIQAYMKEQGLEEDAFLAGLVADMNVAYNKIGTAHQRMFMTALNASQGRQQSQAIDDTEEEEELQDNHMPKSKRSHINAAYASPLVIKTIRSMSTPPST